MTYNYGYNKTAAAQQQQMESSPDDSVTLLKFISIGREKTNFLFCSSWDGSIRAWKEEPAATSTSSPKWKLYGSFQESKQAILRFCFGESTDTSVEVYYSTTEGVVKRFIFDATLSGQKPAEFDPKEVAQLENPYPINGLCLFKSKHWLVVAAMNGFIGCFSTKESDMVDAKPKQKSGFGTSFGTGSYGTGSTFSTGSTFGKTTTGTTGTKSTFGTSKQKVFKLIVAGTLQLRIIDIGLSSSKLYIACTNMAIAELDLSKPITPGKTDPNTNQETPGSFNQTSLNFNLQSLQDSQISAFAVKEGVDGFISGSIQGRIEIKTPTAHNYTDVFHRTDTELYSVNSVATCNDNVMMSGGGDGQYYFYNFSDGKPIQKPGTASYSSSTTKTNTKLGTPITAVALSHNHEYCAWALGEDWSKGYEEHDAKVTPVTVFVKKVTPQDVGQQAKSTYSSYSSYNRK